MNKNLPNNTFFDINKLPKEYGILVFPISISRMHEGTGQSPKECMEYIKHFSPSKVTAPNIGLNMLYGDFLYLHSQEPASNLKKKYMTEASKHRRGFESLLTKEWERFQIRQAFSFESWSQLYMDYDGDFASDFSKIKKIYEKDEKFQEYVKEDTDLAGRELTEDQINFFLEEHLMFYLISKGKVGLPNHHVQGKEEWVLWCYPGVPLKGQAYLYQLNPLKLDNPKNPYQNSFYDLESKKLVDFGRVDLETYNYSYE